MASFETRFERLELKYLIDERAAERIRQDIAPYCDPDEHNRMAPGIGPVGGYPVLSLYLDSPALAFHQAKERGDPNRVKLRVRSYEGLPSAILELKRRVSDVIDKTRMIVPRDDVAAIAQGWADVPDASDSERKFLADFSSIVATAGALPTLYVHYEREAHASVVDHYARVTFDRAIRARRTTGWNLAPDREGWSHFDRHWARSESERNVVLEIKCQSMIPWWVTELVRDHALNRQSFSKYSVGIHLTGVRAGADLLGRRSARWMQ